MTKRLDKDLEDYFNKKEDGDVAEAPADKVAEPANE
jgi:hypothetical protein